MDLELHSNAHNMTAEWTPHQDTFLQLAQMMGVIDKEYSDDDVGEFVAYWCGQPHKFFTPYQWTHKFVQQIKRKRTAMGGNVKRVGNQIVAVKASVQADENARRLVEKYRK